MMRPVGAHNKVSAAAKGLVMSAMVAETATNH